MIELDWQEVPGGFAAAGYRVRRLPGAAQRVWQLEIRRRGPGVAQEPELSNHRTLSGAKARAAIDDTERVRRLRLQVHLGAALVAAVGWAILASVGVSSPAGLVIWLLLFVAVLKALANASAAMLDDQDGARTMLFARWIRVDSLLPPLRYAPDSGNAQSDAKVRVLDPIA